MKELFQKYRSVIRFVVIFLGTYLAMSLIYAGYLSVSQNENRSPDYITNLVARQSSNVINTFGYSAKVIPNIDEPTMKLTVNGRYLAKIIEGCNSISVIIMFAAFVLSFAQQWKKTLLFLIAGAALIYAFNIIRIVILAITLFEYPQHKSFLHDVVFPGIIYGMVFVLWMLWVRSVSTKTANE